MCVTLAGSLKLREGSSWKSVIAEGIRMRAPIKLATIERAVCSALIDVFQQIDPEFRGDPQLIHFSRPFVMAVIAKNP